MRGYKQDQQEHILAGGCNSERASSKKIKDFVDKIFEEMWPDFDWLYAGTGRPRIPPEQLLKALLVQVLFTIRSETQLVEQLRYNLLYRWFIGLGRRARFGAVPIFPRIVSV